MRHSLGLRKVRVYSGHCTVYCVLYTPASPPLASSTIKQHICMLRPAQYIWGIKLENIFYNNILSSGVASLNTLHSTQVLGRLLQNILQMEVNDQDTRLVSHPPLINVHLTMQPRSAENI